MTEAGCGSLLRAERHDGCAGSGSAALPGARALTDCGEKEISHDPFPLPFALYVTAAPPSRMPPHRMR